MMIMKGKMAITAFRLFFVALALLLTSSSTSAAESSSDSGNLRKRTSSDAEAMGVDRKLDASWTVKPTEEPTERPTLQPTEEPTKAPDPTEAPTMEPTWHPTKKPTALPTPANYDTGIPDICGSISCKSDEGLLLGRYNDPSWKRTPDTFQCIEDLSSSFFYKTYNQYYSFRLDSKCEYQFRGPNTGMQYVTLNDINDWIEQAAITFKGEGGVGYKVSEDDIIFSGLAVPDDGRDDITENISECPETYCVKVTGPAVTSKSLLGTNHDVNTDHTNNFAVLYAFSNEKAWRDFRSFLNSIMRSRNKRKIFGTNHFLRCGCESFCMEDDKRWDDVEVGATCYVETICGQRTFQIQYKEDYPGDQKASWADNGTTKIMEWFDECATAMYGCQQITKFDMSLYEGGYWYSSYKSFPKIFQYDEKEVNPLPKLNYKGTSGPYPLGECEGHCSNDSQCEGDLICPRRNRNEEVRGCQGNDRYSFDYCRKPEPLDPNLPALITKPNVRGKDLGNCEGKCYWDSDCKTGLKCFRRWDDRPIPGCAGRGIRGNDYCYDPSAAMPTSAPTPAVSMLQYPNIYGLGGGRYEGFSYKVDGSEAAIAWSCSSVAHRQELDRFGAFVAKTEFMRDASTGGSVPELPCKDDFREPLYADMANPGGPNCADIKDTVFCYQMKGATCYAKTSVEDCGGVKLFLTNTTSTYIYDDVAVWHDDCLAMGAGCKQYRRYGRANGKIVYTGGFYLYTSVSSGDWVFVMYAKYKSIVGNYGTINYKCDDWQSAYSSQNFTYAAGDYRYRGGNIKNDYGDLYKIKPCTDTPTMAPSLPTDRPSMTPSVTPTISLAPSASPSQSPTLCSESYLTSSDLNIALVIDLSHSTYRDEFSSVNPVGDLNNDGKANTILDAQVAAIQELLESIAMSPSLRNSNSEIGLISFSTDAKDHGTWKPLNDAGNGFNLELMDYIKENLRAPKSSEEVRLTNNGFTNFDAALDASVEYFKNRATKDRKNLLVFLSDGEPNVRGDGDYEGYCADTALVWNEGFRPVDCADLQLEPGEKHEFCRGDDRTCAEKEQYQDCVRGPHNCTNADAVMQYDSEISALTAMNVERLAIGVGYESNVTEGSALWMIDNNPAKNLGVLPLQALNLDELSEYVSSLCILNTDPPTGSPSVSPSLSPTKSFVPSTYPSVVPTATPTTPPSTSTNPIGSTDPPTGTHSGLPTITHSEAPTGTHSGTPSSTPTGTHSGTPSSTPTGTHSGSPTGTHSGTPTGTHSGSPTGTHSGTPSSTPTGTHSGTPTVTHSGTPSSTPTGAHSGTPTGTHSGTPTGTLSGTPSSTPTGTHSGSPTGTHSGTPSSTPTGAHSGSPTVTHSVAPTDTPRSHRRSFFFRLNRKGEKGEADLIGEDIDIPIGPEECPNDILFMQQTGFNPLPQDTVKIISQDMKSVTVELTQTFTLGANSNAIDGFYYQYQYDELGTKCDSEPEFPGSKSKTITIQCWTHSPIAFLEIWIADSIEKGILSRDDNAVIPKCCYPSEPEGTPATKYTMVINCRTACPDELK